MILLKWGGTLVSIVCLFILCDARVITAAEPCTYTKPDCTGPNCVTKTECVHGKCTPDGLCECQPCYKGDTCSEYNDRFGPRFLDEEDSVIYILGSKKPVYRASARDDDHGMTCPPDTDDDGCPCGRIQYSIRDVGMPTSEFFTISKYSGVVTVKTGVDLKEGKHELTLVASSVESGDEQQSNAVTHQDVQSLTVIVRKQDSEQRTAAQEQVEAMVQLKDNITAGQIPLSLSMPHVRRKRDSAGADNDHSSTSFVLSEDITPPASIQPGNSIDYTLTIVLPTLTTAMDLVVEVFVMDVVTGETPFALCNARVVSIGAQITDDADAALDVTKINSDKTDIKNSRFPLIDRNIFDFGQVKNGDVVGDGSLTNSDDSKIVIKFTAVAIVNAAYLNTTCVVSAGAEYANQNFVWVSQSTNPCDDTLGTYPSQFNMQKVGGGDQIAQYAGGTFTIDGYVGNPFDTMTCEAFTGSVYHDQMSYSNIQVTSKGDNFACMSNDATTVTYYDSVSHRTHHRAAVQLDLLLKNLDYSNLPAVLTDDGFKISISFSVFVLDALPGDVLNVSASCIIGTDTIWTGSLLINVIAGSLTPAANAPDAVTLVPVSETAVGAGGTVTFGVKFTVPDGANALLDCAITGDADNQVCGVQWGDTGSTIALLPDLSENVVYDPAAYSASLAVDVNSTSGVSYVTLEVSVHYPGTPGSVTVSCTGVADQTLTATAGTVGTEDISGESISLVGGTDVNWYMGSQAGFVVVLEFPRNGIPYNSLIFEAASDLEVSGWGARVCRARITSVGKGVPCLYGKKKTVNDGYLVQKARDESVYEDSVKMDLGPACGVNRLVSSESDYKVELSVYFDLPLLQTAAPATEQLNISGGTSLDLDLIFTVWNTILADYSLPTAPDATKPPIFGILDDTAQTVSVGVPYMMRVTVKLHPQSVSVLAIKAYPDDPSIMKICKVIFLGIGDNYPCVDPEPYGKHTDPTQITKVTHDPADWGASVLVSFGALRNVAKPDKEVYPSLIADEDSIHLAVLVRGVVAGAATMTVEMDDTGTVTPVTQAFTVTGGDPAVGSLTFTVSGTDGTDEAYKGVMKMVDVKITVAAGYGQLVSIKIVNTAPTAASLCLGAVYEVGLNLPCVIPALTESVRNATDTEEYIHINLNQVCYYEASTNESENYVTARFGAMFIDDSVNSATFSVFVTEGATELAEQTYTMTRSSNTFVADNVTEGTELVLVDNTTTTVEAGQLVAVAVGFTIPPFKTLNVEMGIMTPSDEGRAYVTVHGFRFRPGGGKNIGCLLSDCSLYNPTIVQNSSFDMPMIHESQTDTLVVDLGFLTNTGISYISYTNLPQDDQIWVEAILRIADHTNASTGSPIFDISFAFKAGHLIHVIEKQLELVRTGAEVHVVTTELEITSDTEASYKPWDQISFTARAYHELNSSQVELNYAILRIFKPKYVTLVNDTSYSLPLDLWQPNISGIVTNLQYIDYNIQHLFFTDILEVNFTLTVDPDELLPKGLGDVNATVIMRMVCTTNLDLTVRFCSNTSYATFVLNGPDCFDPLGVDTMQDCQFSASTAIKASTSPAFAKTGSGKGWSPAVLSGAGMKDYITIDFLKKTRVTKVAFESVPSSRKVTKFKIQFSHSGKHFTDACPNVLDVVYPETVLPLECRFEARYARIVIVAVDGVDGQAPIGVRFNWFGCPIESVNDVCNPNMKTPLTDTTVGWRHVAYDSLNGIYYFCHIIPKKKRVQCYSTVDGEVWNAMPSYIGQLVGFHAATGKMYAKDRKGRTLVSSLDGINWATVPSADAPAIEGEIAGTADAAQPVEGQVEALLSPVTFGPWTADYTGISLDGAYKAKWANCCS